MKLAVGLLYLATSLIGLYWAIYLTLTGLYGVPFSPWYAVIFAGAMILLAGAVLWWASSSEWTRYLPILGSALLATYFVPGIVVLIREGNIDLIRVLIVLLVLTSLVVAVVERHAT